MSSSTPYLLACPACGHEAGTHANLVGCSRDDCECCHTAVGLYAAECERLADRLSQFKRQVHDTVEESVRRGILIDTLIAERDAARAEAQAFLRERNAAVDAHAPLVAERDALIAAVRAEERAAPRAGGEDTARLYAELIMAVGRKYRNETRHQTALRYILQAETVTYPQDAGQTDAAISAAAEQTTND